MSPNSRCFLCKLVPDSCCYHKHAQVRYFSLCLWFCCIFLKKYLQSDCIQMQTAAVQARRRQKILKHMNDQKKDLTDRWSVVEFKLCTLLLAIKTGALMCFLSLHSVTQAAQRKKQKRVVLFYLYHTLDPSVSIKPKISSFVRRKSSCSVDVLGFCTKGRGWAKSWTCGPCSVWSRIMWPEQRFRFMDLKCQNSVNLIHRKH